MVRRMLSHVAAELCYFDLPLQLSLKASKHDLALSGL